MYVRMLYVYMTYDVGVLLQVMVVYLSSQPFVTNKICVQDPSRGGC